LYEIGVGDTIGVAFAEPPLLLAAPPPPEPPLLPLLPPAAPPPPPRAEISFDVPSVHFNVVLPPLPPFTKDVANGFPEPP
jgi:hypothetical protein